MQKRNQKTSAALAELSQLNDNLFYKDILKWDEKIWNFVKLDFENRLLPTLFE